MLQKTVMMHVAENLGPSLADPFLLKRSVGDFYATPPPKQCE